MENYTGINAKTIDKWVSEGWRWGIPVSSEICADARSGKWDVLLTPRRVVPKDWFHPLKGKRLLGLACGGGQQMPIFSILGADCTVFDLSDKQLETEKLVSMREGYSIKVIKGDMAKRLPFDDSFFDIIFHPVSNCYVEDVYHVWSECYRVIRSGGVLLSGMDNGINFLFDSHAKPLTITNSLPYNPLKNSDQMRKLMHNYSGIQFSHTFDEQIGGQLKAGFVIIDAYEDYDIYDDDSDALFESRIPTYWATKAIKP